MFNFTKTIGIISLLGLFLSQPVYANQKTSHGNRYLDLINVKQPNTNLSEQEWNSIKSQIDDPEYVQQAYVKASNTDNGDYFGYKVAISGDTLVVGAYQERSNATGVDGDGDDNSMNFAGAAYVFTRNQGVWSQQAYLKASNTDPNDLFGTSVAIAGNTIVVGANFEYSNATGVDGDETDNSAIGAGAAYVFTRTNGIWSQQAYLKASNAESNDRFGHSVAISGDTIAIGAHFEQSGATGIDGDELDNSINVSGAVYVFTRESDIWSQQAYIKASNTGIFDRFGNSVAINNDTLVVGSAGEGSNATGINGDEMNDMAGGSGAAYVFTRVAGIWMQDAYLKASNSNSNDRFGNSVSLYGNTIVVGAHREDSNATGVDGDEEDNSVSNSGAVYVFALSQLGDWRQQAYLKSSNTNSEDEFGYSVAIYNGTVIVGARYEKSNATGTNGDESDNSANNSGAAYVFTRNTGTWSQLDYIKASNSENFDQFGQSVSIDGDSFVIGAYLENSGSTGINGDQNSNSEADSGAVYVFSPGYSVGGTISGLAAGSSVVLQNNAGDDLVVNANGEFNFDTHILDFYDFAVTILNQPTVPNQICTITGGNSGFDDGTGTILGVAYTGIVVDCTTVRYSIGGSLVGLVADSVTLQNNATDDLILNTNGNFVFPLLLDDLSNFAVTVLTEPTVPNQTCAVTGGSFQLDNGTGNLSGGSITDILVTCTVNQYNVGGTLSGLTGDLISLQLNNGLETLAIGADADFTFATALDDLSVYTVTVQNQPSSPDQICTVTGGNALNDDGNGKLAGSNDDSILVKCGYSLGGVVSGLGAGSVSLQYNGGESLVINNNGVFQFNSALNNSTNYMVTVQTQPTSPNQTCIISGGNSGNNNGTGTINTAPDTSVVVSCNTAPIANSDNYNAIEDTTLIANISVLDNDTDIELDTLSVANSGIFIAEGIGGTITINADGTFVYLPPSNISGVASFIVDITDGLQTSSSLLTIEVLAANDAPDFSIIGDINATSLLTPGNDILQVPNFAFNIIFGPDDENSQSVQQYNMAVISDFNSILDSISVSNEGTLDLDFSLNFGQAIIQISMQDDGGTENNGVDTSNVYQFTITHLTDNMFSNGFE